MERPLKICLGILGAGILAWFIYLIRGIMLPFVLSIAIAYLLNPLVNYFENRGYRRIIIVACMYLVFLVFIIGSLSFLVPAMLREVSRLRQNIPQYSMETKTMLGDLQQKIEKVYPAAAQTLSLDAVTTKWDAYLNRTLSMAPKYLKSLFSLFSLFIIIPFITFFTLNRGKEFIHQVFNFLPSRYVETILSLICEIDEALGNFLRGQIIAAAFVGFFSILGLYALGIDYALVFGIIAGLGNLVPFLGPVMGAVPASLIALFKYKSFFAVVKVLALFSGIQFLDNVFISPYVVGKSVDLHPLFILFALMAGAELFGVLGVLFGVPAACAVKVTIQVMYAHYSHAPAPVVHQEQIIT